MGAVFTELDIKRALDGTFTRLSTFGEFKTDTVPHNYIPTHASKHLRDASADDEVIAAVPQKAPRTPFSTSDVNTIIRLHAAGKNRHQIAKMIGRGVGSISVYLYKLRKAGRIA